MNAKSIAIVGAIGFVVVLLLSIFLQFMFLGVSAVTLLLLVAGFWIGPHSNVEVKSTFHPASSEGFVRNKNIVRIQGKELSLSRPYELLLKYGLKNRAALFALLLITFGGIVAYLSTHGTFEFFDPDSKVGITVLALGYVSIAFIIPALIWFEESLLIRQGIPGLAVIEARLPHWVGTSVRYYFKDFRGEHSGGYAREFGGSCAGDDLAVVVYSRLNPQFSKPSFAFWFHEIKLETANEQT